MFREIPGLLLCPTVTFLTTGNASGDHCCQHHHNAARSKCGSIWKLLVIKKLLVYEWQVGQMKLEIMTSQGPLQPQMKIQSGSPNLPQICIDFVIKNKQTPEHSAQSAYTEALPAPVSAMRWTVKQQPGWVGSLLTSLFRPTSVSYVSYVFDLLWYLQVVFPSLGRVAAKEATFAWRHSREYSLNDTCCQYFSHFAWHRWTRTTTSVRRQKWVVLILCTSLLRSFSDSAFEGFVRFPAFWCFLLLLYDSMIVRWDLNQLQFVLRCSIPNEEGK